MSAKQRLLILAFSDLARDPRVHRQVAALKDEYCVTTLGFASSYFVDVPHLQVKPHTGLAPRIKGALLSLLRWDDLYYWSQQPVRDVLQMLKGYKFDVILANDLDVLPVTFAVANGARIALDAHEYAPREFEDRWTWRLLHQRRLKKHCDEYLPRLSSMSTVCESLAKLYAREYGVDVRTITNATAYEYAQPSAMLDGQIRMIHHGVAAPSRRPEEMIRLMDLLDERFTLDLMFVSESSYVDRLRKMAAHQPRIHFVDPVPMPEIARTINRYDVGLFMLPPVSVNYSFALPNKFFEFVQGRLAVAIGPSPEMSELARNYEFGIVANDFTAESMAARLSELTAEQVWTMKQHAHLAAEDLCAERNAIKLSEWVRGL